MEMLFLIKLQYESKVFSQGRVNSTEAPDGAERYALDVYSYRRKLDGEMSLELEIGNGTYGYQSHKT